MSKQQTAVEWLLDRIEDADLTPEIWDKIKVKAKQMEKEQIEIAYQSDRTPCSEQDAEDYYNQTYGGEK